MNRKRESFSDILSSYFGDYNMTWPKVLIFALITAVITAAVCIIKPLGNTSLHDIAVYPDMWILFAVFITVNCRKWWEAALKCFVFFLVSQPLIYLMQVPFSADGWGIFRYYKYWFIITLLTLPGGAIAFLLKKRNALSVIILSVANGYFAYAAIRYFEEQSFNFPNHLLSGILCVVIPVFLIFALFDKAGTRTAALAVFAAFLIAFAVLSGVMRSSMDMYLENGNWSCTVNDETVISVDISDGNHAKITGLKNGSTKVRFISDNGTVEEYIFTVSGKSISMDYVDLSLS